MRWRLLPLCLLASCGPVATDLDEDGGLSADASVELDGNASVRDGGRTPVEDGGALPTGDAGAFAPDAGPSIEDAGSPDEDAGPDDEPMSWGSCSTGTASGECFHVDDCGSGYQSVPGFCPGNADIQCCVPVAEGECVENPAVDDMPQPNDGLVEAAGDLGCPAGMAAVDAFCVDRYEAALVEILDDDSERPWSPFFDPGARRVRAVSLAGAVPQAHISGEQAEDACLEAGKRLCTDAEWLRACRGVAQNLYPYGDARDPGVCNDARSPHPVIDYYDTTADWIWSALDNACINQQEDSLALTGDHAGCVSDDGAFDMMGNLHEWTADPAGTFRGGFYVDTTINGDGCLYATTAHSFGYSDYSTGFRCCADAQ